MLKRILNSSLKLSLIILVIYPFFISCNKNSSKVNNQNQIITPNNSVISIDSPVSIVSPTFDEYDKAITKGIEDICDLSVVIEKIIGYRSIIDSNRSYSQITLLKDFSIIQKGKGLIRNDTFIEPTQLNAIKVYNVELKQDSNDENGNKQYFLLFIQMKENPTWVFWSIHNDVWNSQPDRSISIKEYNDIVANGVLDLTDLTDDIYRIFSLEEQKKSDPELIKYSIDNISLITDDEELSIWKDALEHDEYLSPTKLEAIKVFFITTTQEYEPPRNTGNHIDVAHNGQNSFFVMFIKTKISNEWIYWGSFI
jgi:hypothetical protein